MANFYAVEYTNQMAVPKVQANSLHKSNVPHWLDSYEASSTASGSVLYFFTVPAGHAIISGNLLTDALGSSVTLKVGTSASDALFLAATTCNTANLNTALTVPVDNYGAVLTADTTIIVTVGGASATGTIKLALNTIKAGL